MNVHRFKDLLAFDETDRTNLNAEGNRPLNPRRAQDDPTIGRDFYFSADAVLSTHDVDDAVGVNRHDLSCIDLVHEILQGPYGESVHVTVAGRIDALRLNDDLTIAGERLLTVSGIPTDLASHEANYFSLVVPDDKNGIVETKPAVKRSLDQAGAAVRDRSRLALTEWDQFPAVRTFIAPPGGPLAHARIMPDPGPVGVRRRSPTRPDHDRYGSRHRAVLGGRPTVAPRRLAPPPVPISSTPAGPMTGSSA